MRLRIITPFYFSDTDEIKNLLASLQAQIKIPAEIVLWNNGGDLEFAQVWVQANAPLNFDLVIAGSGKNLGFACAVNRAAEVDSGKNWDALLCLNPDATLLSPIDENILGQLLALNGLAGLRVFNDAGRRVRQMNARSFPSWRSSISGREGLLTRYFPQNPWSKKYLGQNLDTTTIQRVDWVSGCALFCPRDLWQRLKGFDEAYFFAVEDVDLGRKAQKNKVPVFYAPLVDVAHEIGSSARKRPLKSDLYHHLGMWIYYIKWSSPLGFLLGPFVFLGIGARFLFRRVCR